MSDTSYDVSSDNIAPDNVGFEISNSGALLKRKDFLETDAAAQSHSHRHYYYKKEVDISNVVNTCTQILISKPISVAVSGSSATAAALSNHEMDSVTRARLLFVRGVSYIRDRKYAPGIQDLTEVIESQVDFVGEPLPLENMVEEASMVAALYSRGVAYSKMDALNDAIRDFTSVLELDQDHVQAAYSRAACYNAQGQLVKAIEDYNLALMKDDTGKNGKLKGSSDSEFMKSPMQQRRKGSMAVGVEVFVNGLEQTHRNGAGMTPPRPSTPNSDYGSYVGGGSAVAAGGEPRRVPDTPNSSGRRRPSRLAPPPPTPPPTAANGHYSAAVRSPITLNQSVNKTNAPTAADIFRLKNLTVNTVSSQSFSPSSSSCQTPSSSFIPPATPTPAGSAPSPPNKSLLSR